MFPVLRLCPVARLVNAGAAFIVLLTACADATSSPRAALDLSLPLAHGSPASQRVDSAALATAYDRASTVTGVRSLLVMRGGVIVGERYFGSVTADSLSDVRSVTKSIVSLLMGIAVDRGLISGTSEPLDSLIHPPVASVDSIDARISVGDLLTMTGGFAWDESTAAGYNAWVLAPDQITYVLTRPLANAPGTHFTYNSAGVHLLAVGLGIVHETWETLSGGYVNGGAGLSLRTEDLAKLGQLVLQGGASGAQQLVPASWVQTMLTVHERPGGSIGPVTQLAYGYLWWLATVGGHDVAFAWGYRGQFIFLVPDQRLVVVATSSLDAPVPADDEAANVLGLIVTGVLPAVR